MFSLRDFFHLPELDEWIDRMVTAGPGLAIIAGLDVRAGASLANATAGSASGRRRSPDTPPRSTQARTSALTAVPAPAAPVSNALLPSGRSAIFSVVLDTLLEKRTDLRCRVVAQDSGVIRIPDGYKRRIKVWEVVPPFSYAGRVDELLKEPPGILVLDRIDPETLQPAFKAAGAGWMVLSQLNTVFQGEEVSRQLLEMGTAPEQLPLLRWVISVQRLPTLCPRCKRRVQPDPFQLDRLRAQPLRFPAELRDSLVRPGGLLSGLYPGEEGETLQVFESAGCKHCRMSGRQGEVTVFDVYYQPPAGQGELPTRPYSVLPAEGYIAKLVELGYLPLEEFLDYEKMQYRRMANSLLERDGHLQDTSSAYERKLAELEAANRVLDQRTRSLVQLHEIGQALVTSFDLQDLASRMCRFVQSLCGADRVIVYYLRTPELAEVLASGGWDPKRVPGLVDPASLHTACLGKESKEGPAPYPAWPPGIPPRNPDVEGAALRTGLCMPLVAQDQPLGYIVMHSTRKMRFSQAETALLQTLAHQAALGIQRASLVEDLRDKIEALEAAQVELRKKERLERELELARQVQQSMLPRTFPQIPGYRFAARSDPARRVGGDFYDVIPLEGDKFGVLIADVSDKGLSAALYMSLCRSLLRAEARRETSPRRVLESVNRLLLDLGQENMFVSLFYGVIDRLSRQMTYTRAGHDWPVLLRGEQSILLGGDGTPLGILVEPEFRLTEEEIALQPGDRLVLYTDGMTDINDPDGRLFDREQLNRLLQQNAAREAEGLCEALFTGLLAYQGEAEQNDDMSALIVEVVDGEPAGA